MPFLPLCSPLVSGFTTGVITVRPNAWQSGGQERVEGEYLSRYWLCDCRVVNSFVINWSSAADRSEENCCQLDSQRALLFLQPLRGLINAPVPPAPLCLLQQGEHGQEILTHTHTARVHPFASTRTAQTHQERVKNNVPILHCWKKNKKTLQSWIWKTYRGS